MAKCSRCGKEIGDAGSCSECGGAPSNSAVDRGVKKASHATGEVLEAGVHATETVAREAKPIVKKALSLGRRGVSKAKNETLGVAKKLKDEDG